METTIFVYLVLGTLLLFISVIMIAAVDDMVSLRRLTIFNPELAS